MRVLVVDDNATNREILTRILASWGVSAVAASDSAHALELVEAAATKGETFDAAVVDYHMPGIDGIAFAEEVRMRGHADVRLVLLTSSGQRGQAAAAKRAGMDAYLTKPVVPAQLQACLLTVLGRGDRRADAPIVTRHLLAGPERRRGRVLVAEDDAVNRKVAAGILGGLGYVVQFATNGAEAVAAVATSRFDLVLMDCQMPVMDGYEATERIRAAEQHRRRTPIVALTASALQSDRQRCLDAGMDDHLAKPIRRQELAAVLERFTGGDVPSPSAVAFVSGLATVSGTASVSTDIATQLSSGGDLLMESISARLDDLFEGLDDLDIASESAELLASYRMRAAAQLDEMLSAHGDVERLQRLAHALKGMAANVGVDVVAAVAGAIEDAARDGEVAGIDLALDELAAAITAADSAVVELLGEMAPAAAR